jgi:hypothetical protein
MKKLFGRRSACSLVFIPPLDRPIRGPLWSPDALFGAQASRHAVRVEVSRVDHHRLWNRNFGRQTLHHPDEDAFVVPSLQVVFEGLGRAIRLVRITPLPTIEIDEDNPAQDTLVSDTPLAVALGKEGLQPRHLRAGQPKGCS